MFVPAHNDRLMSSAARVDADVLLLDIEDSVQPAANKQVARDNILRIYMIIVVRFSCRINGRYKHFVNGRKNRDEIIHKHFCSRICMRLMYRNDSLESEIAGGCESYAVSVRVMRIVVRNDGAGPRPWLPDHI